MDVVVGFESGFIIGYHFLIESDLAQLLGRKVDLQTPDYPKSFLFMSRHDPEISLKQIFSFAREAVDLWINQRGF
ncbi:MAG: hypothetical protein LWX83_11860 [Anaerolineae bacterium]|nr:hypothetical protein [Anaerolineae bacterium]